MRHTFVVAEEDVAGSRAEGDTALEKVVMGAHTGSQLLEQHVTRYAPGRSLPRREEGRDELLFVVSGQGTLELEGEPLRARAGRGRVRALGRDVRDRQRGPGRAADRLDDGAGRAGLPLAARGDRPLRRPAGAARRREAHVPLPRQPGRRLHGRDPVRRDRRAVPGARPQPLLRRARLHRRGRGVRPHRRRVDPAPGRILLPPAARAGALHREHGAGRDADPRRLPSVGRSRLHGHTRTTRN